MNLQPLFNTYRDNYYGWRRVLAHVVFWLLIFFYEAVQTSFTIDRTYILILFTLREVVTIMLVHYFLAYYAIPQFLLKARWFYFFLSVLLSYVLLMTGMYFSLYFLQANDLVTGDLERMTSFFLQYEFFTTLVDPNKMYGLLSFSQSLVIALLIKTAISFYYSNFQKLALAKEKAELEKEKTELELSFLKAQINPHFFFNTLNNIYALIEDKDEFAANIVLKLSDLMRYSLYEANHTKIPLTREMQFIRDYVKLEKIRHKKHVVIETDIQRIPQDLEITPLVLISFVENAFKHGVNNTIDHSWVSVRASVEDTTFTFIVANSKPERLRKETVQGGIGLVNVRRRLDLLYSNRYQLTFDNQPLSYTVTLTMKLYEKPPQLRDRRRRTARTGTHREVY